MPPDGQGISPTDSVEYKYELRDQIAVMVGRRDEETTRTRLSKRTMACALLALEGSDYTNPVLVRRAESTFDSVYELMGALAGATPTDFEGDSSVFTEQQLRDIRDALRDATGITEGDAA